MLRYVSLIGTMLVLFGMISIPALAVTWPQTFSLYAGQSAAYAFDVEKAGQIKADATWTGCQLYVFFTDPTGKVVNEPLALKSSPAQAVYTVTAADLQKGKIWKVNIATPPAKAPSQKPVAQGSVKVAVPVTLTARVPIGSIKPPVADVHIIRPPAIQSVTPATGSPNDTIVVKGTDIPEDKTKAEVWFTLKLNTPAQGTILSASKSGSTITYNVRVPGNDYVYSPYTGPMYVKIKGGAQTNSLDFNFVPCRPPTITSHSPQYGKPGVRTTFTGTGFWQTDRVFFVTSQGDMASPDTDFVSGTQISAVVPPNLPLDLKAIKAYVRYDCKGHWLNGPVYTYSLDPAAANAKPK